MNNSISQVTSIAAAAQEILEGKTIKIATLPIDNLAGEIETFEGYLKVLGEDIADLETIQKEGQAAYKKLKAKLESVKKKTAGTTSHSAEVDKSSVEDYMDAAAHFVEVFEVNGYDSAVDSIIAAKKDFDRSLKFVKTAIKSLDKTFNE